MVFLSQQLLIGHSSSSRGRVLWDFAFLFILHSWGTSVGQVLYHWVTPLSLSLVFSWLSAWPLFPLQSSPLLPSSPPLLLSPPHLPFLFHQLFLWIELCVSYRLPRVVWPDVSAIQSKCVISFIWRYYSQGRLTSVLLCFGCLSGMCTLLRSFVMKRSVSSGGVFILPTLSILAAVERLILYTVWDV